MEYLILWLILGGVVAVIANGKGFDAVPWFIYGTLLFPIALAHVLVKASATNTAGSAAKATRDWDGDTKTCYECAETIKREAKVCRFSGNRSFPISIDKPEPAFEYPDLPTSSPQPTTWQKLWWNPHAGPRKRK